MTMNAARGPGGRVLDEDVVELVTLLGEVFHSGKRRGGDPPPELEEAVEREELGPRHAPVLFAVALDPGLSVSEIARRVGLSLATTSLLVGELSRAGILTRTEDERDRRRTIVTISEPHEELIRGWVIQVVEPVRRALERMSSRMRANFLGGVRILAEESESQAAAGEGAGRVE